MIRDIAELARRQEGLRRDWQVRQQTESSGRIIEIGGEELSAGAVWFWGRLVRTVDSPADHSEFGAWGHHARVIRQVVGRPTGASGPPTLRDAGSTELICYLDPQRMAEVEAGQSTYADLLAVGRTYRVLVQSGYRWIEAGDASA